MIRELTDINLGAGYFESSPLETSTSRQAENSVLRNSIGYCKGARNIGCDATVIDYTTAGRNL